MTIQGDADLEGLREAGRVTRREQTIVVTGGEALVLTASDRRCRGGRGAQGEAAVWFSA